MPTVKTNDGVELFYVDKGEGKPIIMIAGWTCTHNFFHKNIDELAKTNRVIGLNMRAHGASQKVDFGHRISRYAKDVKDVIEALGPGEGDPAGLVDGRCGDLELHRPVRQ